MEGLPNNQRDDEWPETTLPRRDRPRRRSAARRLPAAKRSRPPLGRRTREMLALIAINAALSLFISLVVVIVWDAVVRTPAATPVPVAVATDTAPPGVLTPAPTFTALPGAPVTYRVQPDDTLLTIAVQFDVSVQDIMAANGLENPDFIRVGQELLIPVGGLPEPTPTATPAPSTVAPSPQPSDTAEPPVTSESPPPPTETPTPLPVTPPAIEPEVVVREILGAGLLAEEAAFIFNSGRAARLEGWTLSDAQGNVYTFPNLYLGTGGSVRVHTGSGSNSATDLYWGRDMPVWGEPGDVATLRDESGLVLSTLALP